MRVRPEIAALPPYRPGTDHGELPRGAGETLVRLDNNEAPWPPFPEALDAIQRVAGGLNRYPEISCRGIVEALKTRKPEAAVAAAQKHLEQVRKTTLEEMSH